MDGKELSRRKPRTRCGVRARPRSEAPRPSSASAANIPVDEVATLFRCGKCLMAPIKPPVYTCRSGHLNCGSCYRKLSRDCYKCKEPLLCRNQVLEEVMRCLPIQTCTALSNCSLPVRESRSEQSIQLCLQDPSLLDKLERARKEAELQDREDKLSQAQTVGDSVCKTELKNSSVSTSSIFSLDSFQIKSSSRPTHCPFPCGRKVTCSGLVPHFEFHHPHVLLTKITKNCDVDVNIPYDDIRATDEDEGRCVMFFVVKIDDKEDDGEDFSKSADLLRVTRSSHEMLRRGYYVALLSAGRLPAADSWLLAVWASALYDFPPVTYTIRAADRDGTHCFSFRGPPSSLHKDHRPGQVYQRGECLTVPPAVLGDLRDLRLTITFHSDLPFAFVPPAANHWIPDTHGLII